MAEDLDETVVPSSRPPTESSAGQGPDLENTRLLDEPRERPKRPALRDALIPNARFYQFKIGSRTEAITLDRPCFVGRRPSSPRVARGDGPRLLRVPSPLKEVSATHLEVRQLGSSVIITDLKSTNGSLVMVPGSVPRKLRQGESVVVSPGTLVDIGDDNVLQILPMQRLTLADAELAS